MSEAFDPYYKWLGIGPEEQPANHYRLLGIRLFEPDPDVIQDAVYQRMAHVRTYQLGPRSAISQQILNELAAAKVCLLDPQKKAAYDSVLRSKTEAQASPRPPVEEYPDFTTPAPPRQVSPDRQTKRKQQAWMVPAIVAVGLLCLGLLAVLLRSGKKGEPQAEQRTVRHEQALAKAEPTIDRPAPESKVGSAAVAKSPPSIPQLTPSAAVAEPSPPEEPAPQSGSPSVPPSQPSVESPQQIESRLQAALAAAKIPDEFKSVAHDALKVVEKPFPAGDQDFGKRLLALALAAARKSGDDELTKRVTRILVAGPPKPPQVPAPATVATTPFSPAPGDRSAPLIGEPAAKQAPDIVAKPSPDAADSTPPTRPVDACVVSASHGGPTPKRMSLFDGQTLDGWNYDPRFWSVANGAIHGLGPANIGVGGSFISTKRAFHDFVLTARFKLLHGNSGIHFRIPGVPNRSLFGHQADISAPGPQGVGDLWSGMAGKPNSGAASAGAEQLAAVKQNWRSDGWAQYKLTVVGKRVKGEVNGITLYDAECPTISPFGVIAFHLHGIERTEVLFKDIFIEEAEGKSRLPAAEAAVKGSKLPVPSILDAAASAPPLTPETQPAAETPSVDLLALMAKRAKNRMTRDGFVVGPSGRSTDWFVFPYEPPDEYDLELTYTRSDEPGKFQDFIVIVPREGKSYSWAIRFRPDGVVGTGFMRANGPWFQATLTPKQKQARKLTIQLRVRKEGVKVFLNGDPLSSTIGYAEFEKGERNEIAVHPGPYKTVIQSVQVREVSGKGKIRSSYP